MIRNDYPLSPKKAQPSQALVGIVNLWWFSGYQPLGKPILDFMEKLIAVLLESQVIYGCSQDICCHAQRYAQVLQLHRVQHLIEVTPALQPGQHTNFSVVHAL